MRALAWMLVKGIARQDGENILGPEIDTVTVVRGLPEEPFGFVCYLQIELDREQEGLPINMRFETEPAHAASSEASRDTLFDADLIGPMRSHEAYPAIFRIYKEVDLRISVPEDYVIAAYVDGTRVAERYLHVRQGQ